VDFTIRLIVAVQIHAAQRHFASYGLFEYAGLDVFAAISNGPDTAHVYGKYLRFNHHFSVATSVSRSRRLDVVLKKGTADAAGYGVSGPT
jgi:hypothetical protein